MPRFVWGALAALFAYAPSSFACSVCFFVDDEARYAYLGTTALLTFVPLGMFAGMALWVRRKLRERREEEALFEALDASASERRSER